MANPIIYLIVILAIILVILIAAVVYRYTREIKAARQRVDSPGSSVIETACGPIEYARVGKGYPVPGRARCHGWFRSGVVAGAWI